MQHLGLLHGSVLVNRQWGYWNIGEISISKLISLDKNISSSSSSVTVGILDEAGGQTNTGNVLLYYSSGNSTSIQFMLKIISDKLNAGIRWFNISGK